MSLDKEVSLTMATLICILALAIFWALVLIPSLFQAIGLLISLLVPLAWVGVIVLQVKIFQEMNK